MAAIIKVPNLFEHVQFYKHSGNSTLPTDASSL